MRVYADAVNISQIEDSLIQNQIKYYPAKGMTYSTDNRKRPGFAMIPDALLARSE